MRAREIIRKEYGSSRHFMTPHVMGYYLLRRWPNGAAAAELSTGEGFSNTLYGVAVVVQYKDRTKRLYKKSECLYSLDEAKAYIKELKG